MRQDSESGTFSLQREEKLSAFSVPCTFVDRYLPQANGTFVKIYLCLLRALAEPTDGLSLSGLADHLGETEADVRRGLRYWERQGLLTLVEEQGEIKSVLVRSLKEETPGPNPKEQHPDPNPFEGEKPRGNDGCRLSLASANAGNATQMLSGTGSGNTVQILSDTGNVAQILSDTGNVAQILSDTGTGNATQILSDTVTGNAAQTDANRRDSAGGAAVIDPFPIPISLSKKNGLSELSEKKETETEEKEPVPRTSNAQNNTDAEEEMPAILSRLPLASPLPTSEEFVSLTKIIELYLERPLMGAETQLLASLYQGYSFSPSLIVRLYEYCISQGKTHPNYVEAVAISWHKQGITTVEEAELAIKRHQVETQTVVRAFGLNRAPGEAELAFIHKWFSDYGFSAELVKEACDRSLLQVGRPDFKYTDGILSKWHEAGITTLEQVQEADQIHSLETDRGRKESGKKKRRQTGQFHAFPQRLYTSADYSSMEQQLLGKGAQNLPAE